jgi:prevent-host-death family protein
MTTSAPKREVQISAAEANRGFSRLLREVREGATYVVTSHGRPVARVTPYDTVSPEDRAAAREALFARLRSQPAMDIGPWTREELHDE